MTLVLKGSFLDETGRYRVGDIQDAMMMFIISPSLTTDEECICLAVTDAPLEFKGVITAFCNRSSGSDRSGMRKTIAVFGTSGALGHALAEEALRHYDSCDLFAISRSPSERIAIRSDRKSPIFQDLISLTSGR